MLRHQPEAIGVTLDQAGWADVAELLERAASAGRVIDRALLDRVVAENTKRRFEFSEDGRRIRARQGHSVEVELGLPAVAPPEVLYHGTATRFIASIRDAGLMPGNRHHVHLSADEVTARSVGARHGKPVLLRVAAGQMFVAGHVFHRTGNGVWLTAAVPAAFIQEREFDPRK